MVQEYLSHSAVLMDYLSRYHSHGSQPVINREGNAMFVKADGIGGVTHEWLAPKIREITNRILLILKARRSK